MCADNTAQKQRGIPFEPGQSGNPAGRPKGSRNRLGEAFIEALHADFQKHGVSVVEKVRAEKPDQYLKVIASLLPKEFVVTDAKLDDMSNDELLELLASVRSIAAQAGGNEDPPRAAKTRGPRKAGRELN